jgi:transcriptional regulator with XRE-family HTH domain
LCAVVKDWEPGARRLGDRVRTLRRELGITQETLADRSGLHRTYIADIERGLRNPSLWSIERLAAGLGCEVADLFPPSTGRN